LFSYSVDHLSIGVAFALSSVVSVVMVVAYLRLVVSSKFAFYQAGIAQLVYLVGFSLAHFARGYTGLTITVLSIATVFLIMMLTGKIRWSDVLARANPVPSPMAPMGPYAHAYGYAMPNGPAPAAPPATSMKPTPERDDAERSDRKPTQ
jgi:hypothetical protein